MKFKALIILFISLTFIFSCNDGDSGPVSDEDTAGTDIETVDEAEDNSVSVDEESDTEVSDGAYDEDSAVTDPDVVETEDDDQQVITDEDEVADETEDDADIIPLAKGEYIGEMWNTYYYFANENDYEGVDDTTLYDSSCNPIAEVPADFSDSVCIEGSGILEEGVVINYSSKCNCGRPCPTGGIVCYMELDPENFPWGMGSKSNPLEPLVSFAVDTDFVPFGTTLYVEEFDGVFIPAVDGIGGFKHDGCFRADDVGGGIDGNHFDFFAGTSNMWKSLENIFETGSTFHVYKNGERCSYLE